MNIAGSLFVYENAGILSTGDFDLQSGNSVVSMNQQLTYNNYPLSLLMVANSTQEEVLKYFSETQPFPS